MTTIENEFKEDLDLCEFYKECSPDESDTENYCVCSNYDNCLEYRKRKTQIERNRYNKETK
jgi:hypothetical protein